jgi:hypothetical protein
MSTPATTEPNGQELPADVLRKLLDETRAEAAATRVKSKENVEAAKAELTAEFSAKLAEAHKALEDSKSALAAKALKVSQLQAALNAVVPDRKEKVTDIANRLLGSTDEELQADADRVAKLYGVSAPDTAPVPPAPPAATDPSQGKGNEALPLNGDKLLGALEGILNKGR